MTSMEMGPGIHQSFIEVRFIKRLPKLRRHSYELRRLKLPGIIGAFWLAPQGDSGTDLIIPYASVVPGLKGMRPYSMETFFARVRPLAQNRLGISATTAELRHAIRLETAKPRVYSRCQWEQETPRRQSQS